MKNAAVRIGIVAFGVLVAGLAYESAHRPADPPELVQARVAVSRDIARKALTAFGTDPRWARITVVDAKPDAYVITIQYAATPTAAEIKKDTVALAQTVLLQLTMSGHHANDEATAIVVHAQAGDDPAILGTANYLPAEDKVAFAGS